VAVGQQLELYLGIDERQLRFTTVGQLVLTEAESERLAEGVGWQRAERLAAKLREIEC